MSKRILVTGGAGFIGSHLCEWLLGQGHSVVCLDNFFTGSRTNISHMMNHAEFDLLRADVNDAGIIEVDEVYHLACPASPVHYQRNPARTIKTCVLGTLKMLELCREVGAKMLLSSTSEVYGDPLVHPQTESYWGNVNPIGPRACYDEGKRCAEALAVSFMKQYGVQVRTARIFNTYGPRMLPNDGRVVSNFAVQALRGETLTVYGDGTQTRSFCYVSDMVQALVKLMASRVENPVNLGNPDERTIINLAHKVFDLANRPTLKIARLPLPKDDPTQRCPDISRAKELLGWEPVVDIDEGLAATIEYFKTKVR